MKSMRTILMTGFFILFVVCGVMAWVTLVYYFERDSYLEPITFAAILGQLALFILLFISTLTTPSLAPPWIFGGIFISGALALVTHGIIEGGIWVEVD